MAEAVARPLRLSVRNAHNAALSPVGADDCRGVDYRTGVGPASRHHGGTDGLLRDWRDSRPARRVPSHRLDAQTESPPDLDGGNRACPPRDPLAQRQGCGVTFTLSW